MLATLPLQPTDAYRYKVGPQDILKITIWDHPEITNPNNTANELSGRVVNSDGGFFFPYVGRVQAAGKTVEEIRDMLAGGMKSYIREPQIDVAVLTYRSQRVFVSGEVRTPGVQIMTDIPVKVTDAIAVAGGVTTEADLPNVTLTRGNVTVKLDLYRLYYQGDQSQNLLLMSGDVLNVTERRFSKVFVLGETLTPGSQAMPRGKLTLAEALSDSGGVNPLSANSGHIYVIRGDEAKGKPQIYHLNAGTPDALILADKFDLRARDVVFVDAAPVVRFARVVNNVVPAADLLRTTIDDTTRYFPR
jgi:polysaccharide export outer membrane protein